MDASIIIPTFRRPELLDRCLTSLWPQANPFGRVEVIVVDNCPDGSAREICDRQYRPIAATGAHFHYTVEPKPGVSNARNRGIAASRHEILCFLDDDEEALDGWLGRLVAPFVEIGDEVAMVGGEVEPNFGKSARPEWLTDDLLHLFSCHWGWDTKPRFLEPNEWFGEGNAAIRRSVLAGHQFRTDLGRNGGSLGASEGILFLELRAQDFRGYYAPDARVKHFIHPERLNRRWALRRMLNAGMSDARAHRTSTVRGGIPSIAVNLPALVALDPDALDAPNLKAMSQVYYCAGYALGSNL